MNTLFQLFLCTTDPDLVANTVNADIDGILVEWEAALTGISSELECWSNGVVNPAHLQALQKVRDSTNQCVICRINPYGPQSKIEIEAAIDNGADEIWIPKVGTLQEVETVLARINQRCELGIVVETRAALDIADQLSTLPLAHIHVGINDLAEALGNAHPLQALIDGTIERFFQELGQAVPYGCIGVTTPERQEPIPGGLMISELVRLGCRFGLLRRSFLNDLKEQDMSQAIARVRAALQAAALRTEAERRKDQQAIYSHIQTLLSPQTLSP